MQPSNEKLLYSREGVILLLDPQFAHVTCPEEEGICVHTNSFRPKVDIKSGAVGLFHCVHAATGQLPKMYYKHCTGLFNLSTMTFSTFHHDRHL